MTERRHKCDVKRLFDFELLMDKENKINELRHGLPRLLMTAVKGWTKKRIYVQAFEIESTEKYIELGSVDETNWAARVIKGRTTLSDDESLDFLGKASATLDIFKIRTGKLERFYYILISNIPIEDTR